MMISDHDIWSWYLVTGEAIFLKEKKISGPNLGAMGLNQAQNEVFYHFLEFGSYVFLEIAYNETLQQFITSNRGTTYEKIF